MSCTLGARLHLPASQVWWPWLHLLYPRSPAKNSLALGIFPPSPPIVQMGRLRLPRWQAVTYLLFAERTKARTQPSTLSCPPFSVFAPKQRFVVMVNWSQEWSNPTTSHSTIYLSINVKSDGEAVTKTIMKSVLSWSSKISLNLLLYDSMLWSWDQSKQSLSIIKKI